MTGESLHRKTQRERMLVGRRRLVVDHAAPTGERQQHDEIVRSDRIQDVDGNASLPWKALPLLVQWERAGDISYKMRAAGDRFRELFHAACLDPLKAADMSRAGGCSSPSRHSGSVVAQNKINDVMRLLGGHSAREGCGAWLVLGCDLSIRQWAAREAWRGRPMGRLTAKRTLVSVLDALVKHFGF